MRGGITHVLYNRGGKGVRRVILICVVFYDDSASGGRSEIKNLW